MIPSALRAAAIDGCSLSAALQLRARLGQLATVEQDLRRLIPNLRVLWIELHEATIADERLFVFARADDTRSPC